MGPLKENHVPLEVLVQRCWYIGCENIALVEIMIQLAKNIRGLGKVIRAWKQGEYGFTTLFTLVLPPGTLDA